MRLPNLKLLGGVTLLAGLAIMALLNAGQASSHGLVQAGNLTNHHSDFSRSQAQPWPTPDPSQMIQPGELQAFDNFGTALAVDGDLMAAGAPGTDLESARNAGAVYLFQKKGNTWQPVARLAPDSPQLDGRFGTTLALSGDTLAVSAPYESNPNAGNASGAVYLFTQTRNGWEQSVRLSAADGAPFDLFGSALALNGRSLAVGARAADGPGGERDAGAVYVYQRDDQQGWSLQARLGDGAAAFDHLGHALAFAGEQLLAGAPGAEAGSALNAGQVYIYTHNDWGWSAGEILAREEARSQGHFGASISAGQDHLAIVAPQEYQLAGEPPPNAYAYDARFGVAHIFVWDGSRWQWQARLFPETAGAEEAVLITRAAWMISKNQVQVVLSGYGRPKVYAYQLQDGAWQAQPAADLPFATLLDGGAMTVAGDQILLGSRFNDVLKPGGDALQSAGVIWLINR